MIHIDQCETSYQDQVPLWYSNPTQLSSFHLNFQSMGRPWEDLTSWKSCLVNFVLLYFQSPMEINNLTFSCHHHAPKWAGKWCVMEKMFVYSEPLPLKRDSEPMKVLIVLVPPTASLYHYRWMLFSTVICKEGLIWWVQKPTLTNQRVERLPIRIREWDREL